MARSNKNIFNPGLLPFFISFSIFSLSCGTKVGNPDSTVDSVNFIPSLEFSIPSSVTSLGLTPTNNKETPDLIPVVKRVDRVIQDINSNLERLRQDGVEGEGTFTGKGPNGDISGTVAKATDTNYEYSATICYQSEPFYTLDWVSDGSKVHIVRDFSRSPLVPNNKVNGFIEVYYTEETNLTKVQLFSNGEPWELPHEVTDGSSLADSIYATKSSNDFFQFREVADYYDGPLESPEGDYYVTGRFDGDAKGDFVAYRKNHVMCDTFTESNVSAPGWCLAKPLGGEGLTDDERNTLWETELQAIGIEPASNIRTVTLNAEACP